MGAIYGLVNLGNDTVLKAMGDRLAHRGQARWEWQADDTVWLGCIEHAVNAVPEGDAADLRFACDGDIFPAVSRQANTPPPLAARTIQRYFDEQGADCLPELHGYFALAHWEKSTKTLLLARDMLGTRPIYYWQDGDAIAFASEYKALLCVPGIDATPNLEAIRFLQSQKNVPAGQSLLAGIKSVLPGSVFEFQGEKLSSQRWFKPRLDIRYVGEAQHAEDLRKNFLRAMSEQTAGQEAGVSLERWR